MKILLSNPPMYKYITSILKKFSSLFNYCFLELHHANMSSQLPATRVKNPSQNTIDTTFTINIL